MKVSICSWTWL